jgi:hypothetical protein
VTLWILSCRMSKDMDILFAFYARDRDDAEQHARKILNEQSYERIDLKVFSHGFVMHRSLIPGMIEEDKV